MFEMLKIRKIGIFGGSVGNLTLRFGTLNPSKSTDLVERLENDTLFFEIGCVVMENELVKVRRKSENLVFSQYVMHYTIDT